MRRLKNIFRDREGKHNQSPTDQCDTVFHGKRLRMEGIAGNLWELAYNLCSHEQVEQKWSSSQGIWCLANRRYHPDQCRSSVP